jgi:hypothetical protein
MNEQMALPGIEPAGAPRRNKPKPTHAPTAEDAEALLEWIENETAEPGTLPLGLSFKQLEGTKARLCMTKEERSRLVKLAERWRRIANENG